MVRSISVDTGVWVRLFTPRNSIQVMLNHEHNAELDEKWLTTNERLTHFNKYIDSIVGNITESETPFVQGPKCSEEDLVVRDRYKTILRVHHQIILTPM